MLLKNESARLITIDGISFVPGSVVDLPGKYLKNTIVAKMINKGELVDAEQSTKSKKKAPVKKEKTVDDMTKDELIAYAESKGVDLTGADDKESILALIKASEA